MANTVKIGDNGAIQIGPETTYGTVTAAYVEQHARSATIGPRKALLPSPRLGQNPTVRSYGVGYTDGEIVLAYDDSRAVIGNLLASVGNLSTNDYTIGTDAAPDTESLSVWVDYGGYVLEYLGCQVSSIRFEFSPDSPIVVTAGFLGRASATKTPTSYTLPAVAGVVWDSDITPLTIGGAAMCSLSGSIEVQIPLVGTDRHCLGSSTIKQPCRSGKIITTASLNVELDDATGADSEAVLDLFLAGTTLGDIVIGDFTLSSCYMTGDGPSLGEGITAFPINVEASELVVTTTA